MDAVIIAGSGGKERSPRVSTINRFDLGVDKERAGAGRDGQNCLARPNSQPRTGTGKKYIYLFS